MSIQIETTFNRICQQAAEQRASEIYLLTAQPPFVRVDGQMQSLAKENVLSASFIEGLLSDLLDEDQKRELEKKKQVTVIKEIGRVGNSQISVYYQKGALSLRIKLLTREIIDLAKLEAPEVVKKFTKIKKGIVFITGPRDSGRSTLVVSLLNDINKREAKFISTIEKPIKTVLSGLKSVVEQREVGKDVDSFLSGLGSIRERNIDVVMISQIEDAQVMNELFAIAEAGSLVFAVIDTESAIKTLKRILRFYPADEEDNVRYFLSENLGGIICSRLVPKIGGGRIRALEILSATPAVKSIIAGGKFHQLAGILQASEDRTAISLDQYLADLVSSGGVMAEEALKYCANEEVFRSLLRR